MSAAGEQFRESIGTSGGVLVLAAAPIGNPLDASLRFVRALGTADVVAAEDTRRVRRLATDLNVQITGRVVSCYDHNEAVRADELVAAAADGAMVLLVTDAGTPSISDPGYRVVRAAVAADVAVTMLPGPSAVTTAVALSGLPTDRFSFEGFIPRRPADRRAAVQRIVNSDITTVSFDSPRRLSATLKSLVEYAEPQRHGVICRELTKTFQQVIRGTLPELSAWAEAGDVRGEITVVVAGRSQPVEADLDGLIAQVTRLVHDGVRMKDAARTVAAQSGVSARELYQRMIDS